MRRATSHAISHPCFGYDNGVQEGLEELNKIRFCDQAERVGEEALELLDAPNCPSGTFHVLLLPEQMMLVLFDHGSQAQVDTRRDASRGVDLFIADKDQTSPI